MPGFNRYPNKRNSKKGAGAGQMVSRNANRLTRRQRLANVAAIHPSIINLAQEAAANVIQGAYQNYRNISKPSKSKVKKLTQTKAKTRGQYKKDRHEKLKVATGKPVNKGKGFNTKRNGYINTHSVVPKWKRDRLYKYKNSVYQTVLLSQSNRLTNGNNSLETCRYPIKAPETLDSERIQCMMFTPFCSHYSGVHSTLFRKVATSGTDLDHSTTTLDVIQNRVDIDRHQLPASVDGTHGGAIVYESTGITAGTARGVSNLAEINAYYDQLVKSLKIDLVITSSRAFPVVCSISVVRFIEPTEPNTLTTEDKQCLLNNLSNRGMEYTRFKTEWLHEFTIPALRMNKKPPAISIKKVLKTNFIQTNTFEEKNTAEVMTDAGTTLLGKSIAVKTDDVADGFVSGQFLILIKYRKKQQPQLFTYEKAIDTDTNTGRVTASIQLPVVTDQSFDVPVNGGANIDDNDGSPMNIGGNDESKASFYIHGKIVYEWGFKNDLQCIPSLMSSTPANPDYKKPQSLMIDPTMTTSDTYGIYTQSPDHENN